MTHFSRYSFVFAALFCVSCVPDGELIALDRPTDRTTVSARIELFSDNPGDPSTIDFGQVPAGVTVTREFTVRNIGTDTLQLQELTVAHPSFSIVDREEVTLLLTPEQSTIVRVAYEARGAESVVTQVRVSSNDRTNPEAELTLRAASLAPMVRISPESFDFGNAEIGCNSSVEVEISNIGLAPLEIDRISFDSFDESGELVAQVPAGSEGAVLQPGDAPIVVTIHHVPADAQPDSGTLVVRSNDLARPVAKADIFGIAHPGEAVTDGFAQDGSNQTDILWVIDSSGSMGGEQTSLAVNFSSFVQIVDALEIDYRLGVTTTDTSNCSSLVGSTPVVTPTTPDPAATFASNVAVGTSGSGSEKGFLCGEMALGAPANADFLRNEAGLRVIFVSDEPEQSPGPIGDHVDAYQGFKLDPDDVVMSDISGGLIGCTGASGNAGAAPRYVAASLATGGVSALICDANWVATLSALAWLSQSVADTFELSQTPVESTIEVRVNGSNTYVGWVYNSALQAIVFDLSHIPEVGDEIDIEYAVSGECGD